MSEIELPDTIAVMVLKDCNLFPQGLLPLYIFEEKYRKMLRDSLRGSRMFCVGTVNPVAEWDSSKVPPVFPYSTAGFLRACVGCDDGSSHLILQGLTRIRLSDWDFSKSYLRAKVERVPTRTDCQDTVARLALKLARLADKLIDEGLPVSGQARLHLQNLSDSPEDLADFAAYNLIRGAYSRQILLGEESLEKRLEFVIAQLSRPGALSG